MKIPDLSAYPVVEAADAVRSALVQHKRAVLSSPAGSGKSTVLPLLLLNEPYLADRKIIMLEPRRIAAYAAANQLARNLGCEIGKQVGYRMRLDRKVSADTILEVVTEGMLTNMIQRDPELRDVGLIIFDEFHERSLQADLALALALDSAEALRHDLRILAMSATIDCTKTSELLDNAPVIESKGRSYPVEILYQPRRSELTLSENVANVVCRSYQKHSGSILAFLPGEADIRSCEEILKKRITDESSYIVPLYGRLDNSLQRKAIEPAPEGFRKIVLATSIAESSLTIDGVNIVVDCGFTRQSSFNSGNGLSHLQTVPISQAAAEQRSGRAGRTAPGIAYRLWSEHEHSKREVLRPGEISYSDLTQMALELAAWGVNDPGKLKFMEKPPESAWQAAEKYLQSINAVDENGTITAHGKLIHQCSLSVRSGHLVASAIKKGMAKTGIRLAALLDAVDMRHNIYTNISDMLSQMELDKRFAQARMLAEQTARRLKNSIVYADKGNLSIGALLAIAFPERVARRRGSMGELKYLLASGKAAEFRELDNVAGNEFIVALDLSDRPDNALIQLAAGVEAWELEDFLPDGFTEDVKLKIEPSDLTVECTVERKFGAIVFNKIRGKEPERGELCRVLAGVIRRNSLNILHFPESIRKLQGKLEFIHQYLNDTELPLLSDEYILEHIEELLYSFLPEKFGKNMLKNVDWHNAVYSLLDYFQQQELARLLPGSVKLENNREFKVDYTTDPPSLSGKLQHFFGVRKQPVLLNGKVKLSIILLSPAGRPVQTTSDIGNFWSGSYKLVRNDLKGRYPKHDWPENP
ncbi:MAG: ATP-dependent helicase HrpB [Lentisphaerae bacterium]|nr:ATP-dependent helicase HrpB [Lentisphaerota bacterium]